MAGSVAEERIRAKVEAAFRRRWPEARIIHELVLDQGGVRIDLAAVMAEGAENALSLASLEYRRSGKIIRTCAALSLGRLQGGVLRDNEGRIDPYEPLPDPDVPAFVWPGLGVVLIGVDRDMKRVQVKARTPRGRTCHYWLEAEERARLCARLACAAWAAARARPQPIWPSKNSDLNDDLRRVIALSGQSLKSGAPKPKPLKSERAA